jgi:hypothetical protein
MTAKKKMAVKTKSKKKPTQQPVAITLVPNDLTSAPGQLGTPDVAVVHRRVTDRLAKAKLQLGVGVLEVNLVEHQDGRYPTAWAWHLHGLAFTRKPEALAKRLGKAFPRTDVVPRPVRVTPWDGSSKWPRYCYKLDTRCRIGVDDATHFDVRKQEPRESRGTTTRRLTSQEFLELLVFHDGISLDSRILTKGAQIRSTSEGGRVVKLRRPKRRRLRPVRTSRRGRRG